MKVTARIARLIRGKCWHLSSFRATSDEHGRFSIRGLPEADVVIYVEDPENRWTARPHEGRRISPEAAAELELAMETGVVVSGRVTDPDGKPVEAAHFSALADSQEAPGLAHSSTDADGRFTVDLPAGTFEVHVESPGHVAQKRTISVKLDGVTVLNVDLRGSK